MGLSQVDVHELLTAASSLQGALEERLAVSEGRARASDIGSPRPLVAAPEVLGSPSPHQIVLVDDDPTSATSSARASDCLGSLLQDDARGRDRDLREGQRAAP